MNANTPPGLSQRRQICEKFPESSAWNVAQPEAHEQRVDLTIRLSPGVADLDVARYAPGRVSRSAAMASGSAIGVVDRQPTFAGEQGRPPARARRELDDVAVDRQRVEPASSPRRGPPPTVCRPPAPCE